jgi:hypothetical protein
MALFLTLLGVGLAGLAWMALPGLLAGGDAGADTGDTGLDAGQDLSLETGDLSQAAGSAGFDAGHVASDASHDAPAAPSGQDDASLWRFIPSPRIVFTLMALYGAFGCILAGGAFLPLNWTYLAALVPALLTERLVVRPFWNWMMSFQGRPSAPLEAITLSEARATTTFQNGVGLVCVERDGQLVQLRAELTPEHAAHPVRIGDTLRIESVDAEQERVTVSVKV